MAFLFISMGEHLSSTIWLHEYQLFYFIHKSSRISAFLFTFPWQITSIFYISKNRIKSWNSTLVVDFLSLTLRFSVFTSAFPWPIPSLLTLRHSLLSCPDPFPWLLYVHPPPSRTSFFHSSTPFHWFLFYFFSSQFPHSFIAFSWPHIQPLLFSSSFLPCLMLFPLLPCKYISIYICLFFYFHLFPSPHPRFSHI